ncbi:hypothetical protein GALMADRAFT_1351390 [Galerina marginata CBS 339.88]|uniref:Uncharacterized protein n=1 Tax=Galerina marginata (strain CBS 339.88) TaxID=685588 RepID=A0A067SGI1_GALM3|nr:hypothetical protein GALMADRAFT_1351390 [Galerina marginata CBS 339.88]
MTKRAMSTRATTFPDVVVNAEPSAVSDNNIVVDSNLSTGSSTDSQTVATHAVVNSKSDAVAIIESALANTDSGPVRSINPALLSDSSIELEEIALKTQLEADRKAVRFAGINWNKNSGFPTINHPYFVRLNMNIFRLTNPVTNMHTLYHGGQIALFISSGKRIHARKFKPSIMSAGYLPFATAFNSGLPADQPKRFPLYTPTHGFSLANAPTFTLEDFHINPDQNGWSQIRRRRGPLTTEPKHRHAKSHQSSANTPSTSHAYDSRGKAKGKKRADTPYPYPYPFPELLSEADSKLDCLFDEFNQFLNRNDEDDFESLFGDSSMVISD